MNTSRRHTAGFGAAVVLVLAATGEAAVREISHEPLECVPAGRYARIAATAPAPDTARAELQFRIGPDAPWYGIPMTAGGGSWSALLPRPVAPLSHFEYRVVVTGADLAVVETKPHAVRVVDASASCEGVDASTAVSAPIVVRVPAGAPAMPPVPAGFSPAGVAAAVEAERKSHKTAYIGGAAAVAAGAAAAVAGQKDPTLAETDEPQFTFFAATPGAGSLLTPRTFLSISVLVTGQAQSTVTFSWQLAMPSSDNACLLSMEGTVASAMSTVPVRLSSPLVLSGNCGSTIDLPAARFLVSIGGQIVHDETIDVRYTYVR